MRKIRKRSYIYGIGILGELIYYELIDRGINIDGVIVSDGYRKSEEFKGLRIYELKEIESELENSDIYLSVLTGKNEIINKLEEKKIKRINDYTDLKILEEFKYSYFKECLMKDYKIKDTKLILSDKFKVYNPFLLKGQYQYSFWFEFPDLILPVCKNDFTKVNEGPYEIDEVRLIKDDIVIDAGANIGLFSNYAASKGCRVYSFEPIEETFKVLNKNANMYDGNIETINYALSNRCETVKLYFNDKNTNCSVLNYGESSTYIKVKTTTVDKYVKDNKIEKVDFIKADIEGAERYMLEGAKETIKKFGPKISICTYHLKDDPEILEGIIKEYNNKYVVIHRWKKLFAYIAK